EQHANRAQQDQKRKSSVAHRLVFERKHSCLPATVFSMWSSVLRVAIDEAVCDKPDIGARLIRGQARFQSANNIERPSSLLQILLREGEREPNVKCIRAFSNKVLESKAGGHDSNNGIARTAQIDLGPDYIGGASIPLCP